MNMERIQPVTDYSAAPYRQNSAAFRKKRKPARKPIDAVICDIVDLSDDRPAIKDEHAWLTDLIIAMPEDQVNAKMRAFKNSIVDIDDAVAQKVIIEAL